MSRPRSAAGAPVPVWAGELYFEMHRGTLTSQSATKVGQPPVRAAAPRSRAVVGGRRRRAPQEVTAEIEALWKDVLLQQFHDIIPGSSIAWVAADAEAAHARVAERLEAIIADALDVDRAGCGTSVANAATHARREVIVVDGEPTMVEVPGSGIADSYAAAVDHPVVRHRALDEQRPDRGVLEPRW